MRDNLERLLVYAHKKIPKGVTKSEWEESTVAPVFSLTDKLYEEPDNPDHFISLYEEVQKILSEKGTKKGFGWRRNAYYVAESTVSDHHLELSLTREGKFVGLCIIYKKPGEHDTMAILEARKTKQGIEPSAVRIDRCICYGSGSSICKTVPHDYTLQPTAQPQTPNP